MDKRNTIGYLVSGLDVNGKFIEWRGMADGERDAVIKAEEVHGYLQGICTEHPVEVKP